MKVTTEPRYKQIAVEIADRISCGKYPEGKKLTACTNFASSFNTSTETVRKAIKTLDRVGAVKSVHGRGVFVTSSQKARDFLGNYKDVHGSEETIKEIMESIKRQQDELDHALEFLDKLEELSHKTYYAFPFSPHEVTIDEDCVCKGKTFGELQIWNESGATVIAVKHGEEYIVSPGPLSRIELGDVLYFIGKEGAGEKLIRMLWPK